MRKKLTSLFISAMTLSSLSLSINHSIAMEKEDKDVIDFASCLGNPNSNTFTESIENITGSSDIQSAFFQHIKSLTDSLHKQALLAIHKLFKLQGHMAIDLNPASLFEIFSEGCKTYQKSTVLKHCLAYCFHQGIGTKTDLAKAIELYEIAIEGGFSYSFGNLANIYISGNGVQKDPEKGIRLYEKSIEMGHETSMCTLASLYRIGGDVEKNIPKAIELYEKAIEMGHKLSMYNLAYLYLNGIEKNISRAQELFEKAIEKGHADSANYLAYMYLNGLGVEKNIPKAIELFEKAIEMCYPNEEGQKDYIYNLASAYIKREGEQRNIPKVVELLEKAIEMGHGSSMTLLAMMYSGLGNYMDKNFPKAVELYEKAIEKGQTHAMNTLALMYQEGEDVEKNISKAQELYEKAFLLGDRQKLPSFLCNNDNEDRLFEVEFEHSNLYPDVSIEFSDMLTSGAMSHKKRIQSTIEFLIQKKYKEYILNESKYQTLKDKRTSISESFNFGTPSFVNEDFFLKLKSNNSIVLKIAKELDPRSWISLASTSRYFHKILSLRDIKIITGELIELRANFMNKMKKNRLTVFVDIGEIMEILCRKSKEIKDYIDFTSCLNSPNETEKILASRDIQTRLFEFIMSPSSDDLPCKKTLLAFYKIFELPGHTSIDLSPDALFNIFSESFQTNQENAVLNYCLAKCFQDGIGTKKNSSEAIRMHETAAQKGVTYSLVALAKMYINDNNVYDVEKNYHKALDLTLKAIDLKNPKAISTLAFMYMKGYGVKRNLHKALKLYQKAADLGCADAMKSLGLSYVVGFGVRRDDKKAFNLVKKAHELGNTEATVLLARLYQKGTGVERNIEKAIELYNQAIKFNNTNAMIHLGSISPEKTLDLYNKAIELGYSEAIYSLAVFYHERKDQEGKVSNTDLEKAIELYKKAADLENRNAMGTLGILYLNSNLVKKDTQKALTLFQEAIKLGDKPSINYLALMYARGDGLQKDIEKAKELFKQASELGDLSCVESLIQLYKQKGTSDNKNLLEIYKICFAEGTEKQKKYLPQFLYQNNRVGKLFELEFKSPELLPSFFSELLPSIKLSSKNILIEETLKSFMRRQYSKNLSIFSDPKKYNFLKIEKLFEYKKLPPFPSVNKDSLLTQLPKDLILLIAKNLSPRSLIALASTSRHFYQVLHEKIGDIDIITKDLLRLELAFTSKLRKESLEKSISLGKIMDILEKK